MTRTSIRFGVMLSLAGMTAVIAIAQNTTGSNSDSKNTENVTQLLDRLLQQNQQLELQNQQMEKQNQQLQKQNQELIEQIKTLRGEADRDGNGSEPAAGAASAQATAVEYGGKVAPSSDQNQNPQSSTQTQTAQSSNQATSQAPGQADDKTKFPQASEGNPAIFGEFNPGRGFTVGRSKYGELNLSGYMVARFLDQMPGDQTAFDHMGRPLPITPRKDFQFHRVMLFSQGWLFSPKFLYSTFL